MRRAVLIAVLGAVLAGCGGGETITAKPETVEGGMTQTETGATTETGTTTGQAAEGDAAAGKQVYAANGCGSCHAFQAAGSSGTTGPDLDKLPEFAKTANKDLVEFTRESIEDPNAYLEEGFPEGIMPPYDQLEDKQLDDLVSFLTQS